LYGRLVVRSSFTVVVVNRRVGVTGLYVLIAMSLLAQLSAIGFQPSVLGS
jgi:hypothetical protein